MLRSGIMKTALFICVAACALFSRGDDVLFWFVGNDAPEFCYAKMLVGVYDNGAIAGEYVLNLGYDWSDEYVYDERPAWEPSVQAAVIGDDYAGLSFVVELYNDGDELTYKSNAYHLSELTAYIVRQNDFGAAWRHIEPLSVINFSEPVPEPTSGLLVLIGAAMLALRRGREGCI